MKIEIKSTEGRLELATKVLNWDLNLVSARRIAEELEMPLIEFYRMNDEEFFNTLHNYCRNRYVKVVN